MKKLLIFFVCIPFLSFSQWKFKETNDPFDGKIKAVIATGYGGDYPYKYPSLIITINNSERKIYITDAGSTVCANPYLDVSFGDSNSIISFNLTRSVEGDAGFVNMDETKKIFNLIKLLKTKNLVYFKFGTNCSENTFKMSLKGSSIALKQVFSDIDFSSFNPNIDFGNYISNELNMKISKAKEFAENFFLERNISFSPFDLNVINREIKGGIILRNLNLTEIDIEEHEFLKNSIKVKLGFEGLYYRTTLRLNKKEIKPAEGFISKSETNSIYIDSLLDKYTNVVLKDLIKKTILNNEKLYSFDVNNIEDVFYKAKTIFQKNRIMDGTLLIILRDKTFKRTDLWLWKEKIYLSELPDNFKTNTLY